MKTAAKRSRIRSKLSLMLMMAASEAMRPVIGGQAVVEGVMMRSPKSFAVAVRRKDNSIVVKEEAWLSFAARFPFLKWPLLRGATMLVESMYNGIGALNFSAQQAMDDLEDDEAAAAPADGAPQVEQAAKAVVKQESESGLGMAVTMAISLLFAILIFKGIPHLLTWGIGEFYAQDGQNALPVDSAWFHLVDGVIRLAMFVGYILLISRMDDVKRLFMYHGAEHMSVHTYEAEEALTVANTQPKTTAHPRCGTTLVLLVIATSIVVFVAIIPLLPRVSDSDVIQTLFALAIKIPLMLPVAGLAYEVQRAAAKNPDRFWVQLFIAPGMQMQKLTTRVPTGPEVEVALAALRKTVWREQLPDDAVPAKRGEPTIEVFQDFDDVCRRVAVVQ